ncbi:MAG: amidohydrolase [Alphaproteobacteria bacterium PA2]|nr:MAG: amidohydrolase [Alphaproteobacteria bacterium PA2]
MPPIIIYRARRIHTHNPNQPVATHVAVRAGRILGAGTLEDLTGWGEYQLDERFADKVLLPGLIEGHSHLMAGGVWRFVYCGVFDVRNPQGAVAPGRKSPAAVVEALAAQAAETPDDQPVGGWGYDPIYFGAARMTRQDLDQVSADRPVGVMHASGHIANVNTLALEKAGLMRTGIDHPGVPLGEDGLPSGELKGPEAMMMALRHVGLQKMFLAGDPLALSNLGRLAVVAGVTTATELGATLRDQDIDAMAAQAGAEDFPLRLVAPLRAMDLAPAAMVERALALAARSTDRLRLQGIKMVADGSIQGFSARLRWPGYYNGAPNGLWYTPPETLAEVYALALAAGVQVHTHTNGDEATDLALDCLEGALKRHAGPDHRFILQHCQLADAAQFRRMKALGMGVNLFANHHFYWGEQHRAMTVGPERAERMNACRTALETGVPMAIHSDAPITPLSPLFTAWAAVNRTTAEGRTLGDHQRISVAQALHAITLGAAWTLKLDGEIGSIECGKRADFCVLEDDPYEVAPQDLKDVKVWGTVQDGRVFAA